jgi:hypothetical protein
LWKAFRKAPKWIYYKPSLGEKTIEMPKLICNRILAYSWLPTRTYH